MRTRRKILHFTALLICLVPFLSCKIDHGKSITGGLTDPTLETCLLEPDHQYYVTRPDQLQSGQKVPLVIVIDPHGDGLTAMQKFRDALKDLPVVIAGSNKLRNNYAGFEVSIEHIKNDLLTKYPVDPQQDNCGRFLRRSQDGFVLRGKESHTWNHHVWRRPRTNDGRN